MSANGEEETLPAGKGVLGYLRRGWRACEERLNDVNERYTFELNPEYRLKLRKRIGPTSVGLRFDAHARSYQVALKHSKADGEDEDADEEDKRPILWKAMKKIVIQPEEKRVQAYTQRLSYGPLSLQGIGEYDGEANEWGIRWQLQTFHKEKKRLRSAPLELNDRVTGCLRWDVKSDAPEAEGKYSSAERFSFDVDVGSYHVHVPRLELKVDL